MIDDETMTFLCDGHETYSELRNDMLQRNFCCKPFDGAVIFHGTDFLLLNWIFYSFHYGYRTDHHLNESFQEIIISYTGTD